MIYAKDHFNLHPASPATRDRMMRLSREASGLALRSSIRTGDMEGRRCRDA
jgi:hypothetical protein